MPSYSSYMRQMSVLDKDDDITWITVKGNHIPVKKGQTKEQAVQAFITHQQRSNAEKRGKKWKPNSANANARYNALMELVGADKPKGGSKTKESNGVKKEAAKIYSKLADKMGYVEKADLEKYLDDNEYFNDDVRKEIVKTVGELESQASERHTEKDAPKPVHQWHNPQPRGKYVEGEVERIVESQKKDNNGVGSEIKEAFEDFPKFKIKKDYAVAENDDKRVVVEKYSDGVIGVTTETEGGELLNSAEFKSWESAAVYANKQRILHKISLGEDK